MNPQNTKITKSIIEESHLSSIRELIKSIGKFFHLPVTLFVYSKDNKLNEVFPADSMNHFPEFCKNIKSKLFEQNKALCSNSNKEIVDSLLRDNQDKPDVEYIESECILGLSRMIFPIRGNHSNNFVGAFVIGKYRTENSISLDETMSSTANLGVQPTDQFYNSYEDVRVLDEDEKKVIAEGVRKQLPLLSAYCEILSESVGNFKSMLLLDEFSRFFPDIISTEIDLWGDVKKYLSKMVESLKIQSASIFYSKKDNPTEFKLKSYFPETLSITEDVPLNSAVELEWIATRTKGVVLPRGKEAVLGWVTAEQCMSIVNSKSAIVYSKRIFDGKLLIAVLGFTDGIQLERIDRLLLRRASKILLNQINTYLASIETDYLMNEIGHLLGRASAKIETGYRTISQYGLETKPVDSKPMKENKNLALPSIKNGLFRIDLICRNFKAFKNLREAQFSDGKPNNMEKINIIKSLRDTMDVFEMDMAKNKKTFSFECENEEMFIKGHDSLFSLLLLNLFDNAEKFAYRGTYITIGVEENDGKNIITITNLGVGFAVFEKDLIYDKYYQSVLKSDVKKRTGTGIGLHFCKRFIEKFYKNNGSIEHECISNSRRKKKFEGDDCLTTAKISIPVY